MSVCKSGAAAVHVVLRRPRVLVCGRPGHVRAWGWDPGLCKQDSMQECWVDTGAVVISALQAVFREVCCWWAMTLVETQGCNWDGM